MDRRIFDFNLSSKCDVLVLCKAKRTTSQLMTQCMSDDSHGLASSELQKLLAQNLQQHTNAGTKTTGNTGSQARSYMRTQFPTNAVALDACEDDCALANRLDLRRTCRKRGQWHSQIPIQTGGHNSLHTLLLSRSANMRVLLPIG